MIVEDQRRVVSFLSRPGVLGEGAPERVETHISLLFLTPDRVYKLKRSVRFPYLDFSTQELRRTACEAEVRINRRTAPKLYLGVRSVVRAPDGSLSLDGDGPPVDWLVEMERFDQDTLFDRLAASQGLGRRRMEDLAETVARFHAKAEELKGPSQGGAALIGTVLDGNGESFAEFSGGLLDPGKIARLTADSRRALERLGPFLDERRDRGFVRRCHGDLHLRNIFLDGGKPTLFDAIEFNDDLSVIDVFYDLAFLLMDLGNRGLARAANIALNRYLDITGDTDGLRCLPLFLSVRAAIRSHVSAAMAATAQSSVKQIRSDACRYLDLALSYLSPPPPRLVAVGGISGSGKSRMARELAPYLGASPGARVARSDVLRKRLAGLGPLERLGAEGYTREMTEKTYRAVMEEAKTALACGHSAIADAVFSGPEERRAIARAAREAGVPFTGLWLEAPPEIMRERILKRTKNPSDATPDVMLAQLDYDFGDIDWVRIDSSGSREATLARGRKALSL